MVLAPFLNFPPAPQPDRLILISWEEVAWDRSENMRSYFFEERTCCYKHRVMYGTIESLYYTPETNVLTTLAL